MASPGSRPGLTIMRATTEARQERLVELPASHRPSRTRTRRSACLPALKMTKVPADPERHASRGPKGWRARQTAPRQVRGRSDYTASNGLHRQRLVDVDGPAVAKQRTALGERGGRGEVGCVDDAVPGKRRRSAIGRPTVGPDRCRCAEGTATPPGAGGRTFDQHHPSKPGSCPTLPSPRSTACAVRRCRPGPAAASRSTLPGRSVTPTPHPARPKLAENPKERSKIQEHRFRGLTGPAPSGMTASSAPRSALTCGNRLYMQVAMAQLGAVRACCAAPCSNLRAVDSRIARWAGLAARRGRGRRRGQRRWARARCSAEPIHGSGQQRDGAAGVAALSVGEVHDGRSQPTWCSRTRSAVACGGLRSSFILLGISQYGLPKSRLRRAGMTPRGPSVIGSPRVTPLYGW